MLEKIFSAGQCMLTNNSADDVPGAVADATQPPSYTLLAYERHGSTPAA